MKQKNRAIDQEIDLDFELWRLFDHTRFMIGRLREMELAEFGLTPEQSHVLDILVKNGGVTTINEIVEITQRQHHSISTLINRMTKQGLVTKKKTLTDNRKYDVVITSHGQNLVKKLARESIKKIFSCLTGEKREDFVAALICLRDQAYSLHGKSARDRIRSDKSKSKAG
jgi:DNA-binding MarR family transcriptional regulator